MTIIVAAAGSTEGRMPCFAYAVMLSCCAKAKADLYDPMLGLAHANLTFKLRQIVGNRQKGVARCTMKGVRFGPCRFERKDRTVTSMSQPRQPSIASYARIRRVCLTAYRTTSNISNTLLNWPDSGAFNREWSVPKTACMTMHPYLRRLNFDLCILHT